MAARLSDRTGVAPTQRRQPLRWEVPWPTSPEQAGSTTRSATGLDRRLAALAEACGVAYSRYADDLALSSPRHLGPRQVARLVALVGRVAGATSAPGR